MDLLRFATAGSVDDGKSTLIGRLLHDTKTLFDDQLEAAAITSARRGHDGVDLALITDGLRAEREQGITIDVAYRYFATPTRTFIIADTPGHTQYTRNMVTGASTADLALVLVDARHGLQEQSRRHTCVAATLGIRHLAFIINKMDLVDWSESVYDALAEEFVCFASRLGFDDVVAVPVSALLGDNVVDPSAHMPWYAGPTLLEAPRAGACRRGGRDARWPTAGAVRHPPATGLGQRRAALCRHGRRGHAASGRATVVVLPSGHRRASPPSTRSTVLWPSPNQVARDHRAPRPRPRCRAGRRARAGCAALGRAGARSRSSAGSARSRCGPATGYDQAQHTHARHRS
jgi:sulfate adenylyltransferase subunit 1